MNDSSKQHDKTLRSLFESVVNGEATLEEHRQLEERLLEDEQARGAWLNYVNLHAALRRRFLAYDSAEPDEVSSDDISSMKSHGDQRGAAAFWSRAVWITLAAVLCVFVLAGVFHLIWSLPTEEGFADAPTIKQWTGDVEIVSAAGDSVSASENHTLLPGETVVSRGAEDRVEIRYMDGTKVIMLGASKLTVLHSPVGGKQLQLLSGMAFADVAPQAANAPLLFVTPQTQVRVLGTRFELATDENYGTRLDLESGKVELRRGNEQAVEVKPNFIAIVPATPDPIRVSPRPVVTDTPVRETSFKGLKSVGFSQEGATVVAGASWQALYWYEDDRLEVVPFHARGRKGISLRRQVSSLLAYYDHEQREVNIWDTQLRESQSVFEDSASLRKQFQAKPDRPVDWSPATQIAAMSPRKDWLAFQVGREVRVWSIERRKWLEFARNYDGRFVSSLAASPDGQTLAIAIRRGRVDLVNVHSGKVTSTWPIRHEVPFSLAFSSNGERIAVGLAGRVSVHDVASGKPLADFEQPGLPFLRVAISADGRFVAASSPGDRVWTWDVTGELEPPLLDIGGPIRDLKFAPDGGRLAVLSRSGRLTIWNVAESQQ